MFGAKNARLKARLNNGGQCALSAAQATPRAAYTQSRAVCGRIVWKQNYMLLMNNMNYYYHCGDLLNGEIACKLILQCLRKSFVRQWLSKSSVVSNVECEKI